MFPCLKYLNVASCMTLNGFLCGLTALLLKLSGTSRLCYLFMLLAVISDIADGLLARRLNECTPAGEILDSLADLSSFVVVPAIVFCQYGRFAPAWCVSAVFYTLCGILRLLYFTAEQNQKDTYIGLASPCAMTILLLPCALLSHQFRLPPDGPLEILMPAWCVIVALSMISERIHVKKIGVFNGCVLLFGTLAALICLIIG